MRPKRLPSITHVPARPGQLLRWGLPRDPQAVPHLLALVVSAVATVLITRGLLAVTGYPRLGGQGLHIAHVLWGGLLMLVALAMLLSFVGPVIRPVAAVLAGAGFGLFIDEVGKFVTSDNDYFFRPSVAIMYVIIVMLVLGVHALHGRYPHHPVEHLAGAVDQAVSGIAGGFTPEHRAQADMQLARAGSAPGAAEVAALVRVVPDDMEVLFDPTRRVRRMTRAFMDRVLGAEVTARLTVVGLVLLSVLLLLIELARISLPVTADPLRRTSELLAAGSAVLVVVMVTVGARKLRRDRVAAFTWFQRATLVNLLFTRVFDFAAGHFSAVAATIVDLLVMGVVTVELARLRRAGPPTGVDGAVAG